MLVGDKEREGELPFGYHTAARLMRIARFSLFQSGEISPFLPNSYRAIDDLRALADKQPETFNAALKESIVRPPRLQCLLIAVWLILWPVEVRSRLMARADSPALTLRSISIQSILVFIRSSP